ncbi:MAG: DUF6088 family protein [Gemmatimonadaceae bacterium]
MARHSIVTRIEKHVAALPEGSPVRAALFTHFGQRAALDQALSRLAKRGRLVRIGRGEYVARVASRYGERTPYAERLIEQLRQVSAEIIVPNGAMAANKLKLTTQVPMQLGYLTSGATRTLHLGPETVVMQHAPHWMLVAPHATAGEAVRALAWLGPSQVRPALARLRERLSAHERQQVRYVSMLAPAWLRGAVEGAFADDPRSGRTPSRGGGGGLPGDD